MRHNQVSSGEGERILVEGQRRLVHSRCAADLCQCSTVRHTASSHVLQTGSRVDRRSERQRTSAADVVSGDDELLQRTGVGLGLGVNTVATNHGEHVALLEGRSTHGNGQQRRHW